MKNRSYLPLGIATLVLCLVALTRAWQMPEEYRQTQLDALASQRAFLHAMIDSMPTRHLSNVDNPGQRSFAEHIYHAGAANAAAVDRFFPGATFAPPDTATSIADKDGLRRVTDLSFDYLRAVLENQSDADRQSTLSLTGRTVPVWQVWDELNEHTYWTLGEIVGNFRSVGLAPPAFRFF